MKKLFTLLCAALLATSAFAVPARPLTAKVSQADGTSLTLAVRGDEHFHYCLTTDGLPVLRASDGGFYYAQISGGQLVATAQLAHDEALRTIAEQTFVASEVATASQLQTLSAAARVKRMAAQKAKTLQRKQAEGLGAPQKVNSGKRRGLVVLANFQDVKMDESHTREVFDAMFNEVGYTENGNSMSVHDYFLEQSYGQFDLSFDVVGPVTVSANMAYYGGNDRYGNDKRPGEMVSEACQLVDDDVDFTTYDWDGDGTAEMVFVVYAGYGEASDAYSGKLDDTIWPHMYYLTSYGINLKLDGVTIDTYACSSELTSNTGTRMDGIGTACHEFSHCFGLPDLYDTSGSTQSNFGMTYWSILDIGCYGGDGFGPVGYTSYERWASGWMEPTVLSDTTSVAGMKAIAESPEAYVIYNEANENEYYLLENRQAVNSDEYIPGHGLLVLHVDYDEETWWYNEVNNTSDHQRCTIIAADNTYNRYSTLAGDPYPGTSGKTELSDTSIPRATLYNANSDGKKFMHKPILNIAETDDGLISFDFLGVKQQTGIQAVQTDRLSPADRVTVYNAAGQQVCSTTYADFLSMPLKHGVYVVKTAKKTFKVNN